MTEQSRPPGFSGLPRHVQTASFWIDESGSRNSVQQGFVMAGIKTRHPDVLLRAIHGVRERFGTTDEFKFSRIKPDNEHRYRALVDLLADSDAHLHGLVVDRDVWDPFRASNEQWAAHSLLAGRIVITGMNRNEVAAVFMDGITTPPEIALGTLVKRHVNSIIGPRVTSAVSLNSKTNDLLQAADLVAGSIRALRFDQIDPATATGAAKERVALRLLTSFGLRGTADQRSRRCCLKTARPAQRGRRG